MGSVSNRIRRNIRQKMTGHRRVTLGLNLKTGELRGRKPTAADRGYAMVSPNNETLWERLRGWFKETWGRRFLGSLAVW